MKFNKILFDNHQLVSPDGQTLKLPEATTALNGPEFQKLVMMGYGFAKEDGSYDLENQDYLSKVQPILAQIFGQDGKGFKAFKSNPTPQQLAAFHDLVTGMAGETPTAVDALPILAEMIFTTDQPTTESTSTTTESEVVAQTIVETAAETAAEAITQAVENVPATEQIPAEQMQAIAEAVQETVADAIAEAAQEQGQVITAEQASQLAKTAAPVAAIRAAISANKASTEAAQNAAAAALSALNAQIQQQATLLDLVTEILENQSVNLLAETTA